MIIGKAVTMLQNRWGHEMNVVDAKDDGAAKPKEPEKPKVLPKDVQEKNADFKFKRDMEAMVLKFVAFVSFVWIFCKLGNLSF